MAYCSNCGAKAEGKYCSVCGTPIEVEKHTSSSANNYKSPYVMEISSKASGQPAYNPGADVANYRMKWHKFMIYFLLWLGGICYILFGMLGILSEISGLFSLVGIATIALGVYAIYVRFQLAKFKTDAPKKLFYFYYAGLGIGLLEFVCLMSLGLSIEDVFSGYTPLSWIWTILFLVCNKRYYGVRQDLFIH